MKPFNLSPCVQSAVSALPENLTRWDLARHLIEMHPEYTKSTVAPHIENIAKQYQGQTIPISEILSQIQNHYPKEDLLHTQLVILGLYEIDESLNKLIPADSMEHIKQNLSFNS